MALHNAGLAAHEEAANASPINDFAVPLSQSGAPDDEFGRWLAAQSELFRGKRAAAHIPALLNPSLLNT